MKTNPSERDDFCRVCSIPINDVEKPYTQFRKYCSRECQNAYKIAYNKQKAAESAEKLRKLNEARTPIALEEPEIDDNPIYDVLISLNFIKFNNEIESDTNTEHNARSGVMQKIRKIGLEHKILPTYKILPFINNDGEQDAYHKRYNTMHITTRNMFKMIEYHRELYNKTKNYTNLHSYKNAIKCCNVFKEYVDNLKIIEGKEQ